MQIEEPPIQIRDTKATITKSHQCPIMPALLGQNAFTYIIYAKSRCEHDTQSSSLSLDKRNGGCKVTQQKLAGST